MDVLIETFTTAAAAQVRKTQLNAQWAVALEGSFGDGEDLLLKVWPAGAAAPTVTSIDPVNKIFVIFKPK